MGTCCETICKHRILFPSIQHVAWLPQGHPQGKQKCGKNSKNINLRWYFKFNREANSNTSIQTFICPMCTATLCNLCYIVVCCELLVYVFWQKVLRPQQLYKTASRSLSAIAELLVWLNDERLSDNFQSNNQTPPIQGLRDWSICPGSGITGLKSIEVKQHNYYLLAYLLTYVMYEQWRSELSLRLLSLLGSASSHGAAPAYLQELCISVDSVQVVHGYICIDWLHIQLRRMQISARQRSFAFSGPSVWNSLPPALCD